MRVWWIWKNLSNMIIERLYNEEIYVDLMQDLTRFIERVEFEELG